MVDEQTALRARGPGQDAAATALAAALVELAEQSLRDRPAAEAIVGDIMQSEAALVAMACRAVTPSQREAAEATLTRMVRRAVLDALPPVITAAPPGPKPAREPSTAAANSRKLRPMTGKAPAPGTRPAPATPTTPVASAGRRRLLVPAALLLLLIASLAAWQLLPGDTPEYAAVPAEPTGSSEDISTMTLPEALQLEAAEPTGGPLRELEPAPEMAPTTLGAASESASAEVVAATEVPATAPVDAAPVPVRGALPIEGDGLRVFILYPEGEPAAAEASDLYAALSATGQVPLVVLRDVNFAVGAPRIRFYHDEDAAAARALGEFLEAPNGGWALQDFGHIRPLPAPGTLEIYVPSTS